MLNNRLAYFFLLLLAIPLVGWPVLHLNPVDINSDVFQYLSIANYYLYADHTHIRDAFTVGPVIPILLFSLKYVALHLTSWDSQFDITLVCLLTYLCYSAIVLSLLFICRRLALPSSVGFFLGAVFLFFLPWDSEALSPNGELVSSTFICLALVSYLGAKEFSWVRLLSIGLFLLAAFFTKIQSLPILLLCLYCFVMPAQSKWRLIFLCVILGSAIEAILFYNEGGVLFHLQGLTQYTSGRTSNIYGYLKQIPSRLAWVINGPVQLFPMLLWIVLSQVFLRVTQRSGNTISSFRFSTFWLWYGVCLFTAFMPNNFFPHYFLFFIPCIVLFSASIASSISANSIQTLFSKPYCITLIIAAIILACLKVAQISPINKSLLNSQSWYKPFVLSEQTNKVRQFLKSGSNDFYVHGWDYRYYAYLNQGFPSEHHLHRVQIKAQSPELYLSELLKSPPKYILDVVEHSGFIRGAEWRLDQKPVWAKTIASCYTAIFDEGGLRLYERKNPLPQNCQTQ
jgi:hypothetical protein